MAGDLYKITSGFTMNPFALGISDSESTTQNSPNDRKRQRDSSPRDSEGDSASLPPNKRQKSGSFSDPKSARSSRLIEYKDFFFEDGDIVLETYPYLFQVHSQKLRERLGGFFNDLLDLPETAGGNPMRNGVPLIKLPWVDVQDIRYLLQYTYKDLPLADPIRIKDGEESPPQLTARIHLDYTLSLLHSSSRFNCTRLRQKCVGALSILFRDFSTRASQPPIVNEGLREEEFRKTWAIKALNIFEECNVPAFLPIACYYVAQLPEVHIRCGVLIRGGNRIVRIENQNTVDKILKARKALACCREQAWRWLSQPNDVHRSFCKRPEPDEPLDTCRGVLNRVGKYLKKLGFFDEHRTDSLETLHPVAVEAIVKELCTKCSPVTKKQIYTTNRMTWNALPRIFGLQKWPDLMAMQKTYVSGEDF
ncbi:hypothetical protein DFS33DRAFT_1269364 [Desarmillaria ectypa]|nr:hypothetical protein DFS33DRAFT_1269364 [Desarmillaria ectypa]